jgi:hypothetical protein
MVRRRHAVAYLALAEAAAPLMTGWEQPRLLDRLTIDYANLRAAIRWTIDAGEVELALRFIAAMWRYWQQDGHLVEGSELASAALTMPGAAKPTLARRIALSAAGGLEYWRGRQEESLRWYSEELDVARTVGDVGGEGDALWNLAYFAYFAGDPARSKELSEQARERFVRVGDEGAAARVDWTLLIVATGIEPSIDRLPEFQALYERFERLGDPWYACQTTASIAWIHFRVGNTAEASRWYVRGLMMNLSLRDVTGTTISLQLAALVAMLADRPEDAATLLGASENLCDLYGVKPPLGVQALIGEAAPHERVETALGAERYADRFAAGRYLTVEDAVGLVVKIHEEAWGADWA